LWAEQGSFGAALAAVDERQRDAIGRASAGYVCTSDGWQDFARNGAMTWEYERAGPGNIALIAELPRRAVLSLGFGSSAEAAATLAIGGLLQPFDNVLQQHTALWQAWQAERSDRFSQGTFAGTRGNGRAAPIPVVRITAAEPGISTPSRPWRKVPSVRFSH
jgi:glucoamylase